jgi:hypothetical protein
MANNRIFCIKLAVKDKYYRFSTDKVTVEEVHGPDTIEIDYTPYITTIALTESSISYNGSWSVPSISVSLWDGFRNIISIFERVREGITAEIFYIDSFNKRIDILRGYATDFSFENAIINFSVRSEDAEDYENLLTFFETNAFQTQQIFTPLEINVGSTYEINEETAWTFEALNTRRCRLRYGISPSSGSSNLEEANTTYKEWNYDSETDEFKKSGPDIVKFPQISGYAFISDVCTKPEVNLGNSLPDAVDPYDRLLRLSSCEVVKYNVITFDEDDQRIRINFDTSAPPAERIKYRHEKGSAIAFYSGPNPWFSPDFNYNAQDLAYDYVYVRSEGFRPSDLNDPSVRYGFIFAGQKGIIQNYTFQNIVSSSGFTDLEQYIAASAGMTITLQAFVERMLVGLKDDVFRLNLFHRYEIVEVLKPQDSALKHCYLKLKIHNRGFGKYRHPFAPARGGAFDLGCYEFPDWVVRGDSIKFVNHKWLVKFMDYAFTGLSSDEKSSLIELAYDPSYLNRLKGNRLDMLRSFSELVLNISSQVSGSGDEQKFNDKILNNASGKFGVIEQSSMYVKNYTSDTGYEIRERISFNTGNNDNYSVKPSSTITISSPSDPEFITAVEYFGVNFKPLKEDGAATNYLKVSSSDFQADPRYDPRNLGQELAELYFRNNTYRTIHNPIPQDSKDLGNPFPICYGQLKRIPMVHAVSKTLVFGQNVTSGDDFFVYASHPCNVFNELDITIELLDENGQTPKDLVGSDKNIDPSNIIESPFPAVLSDHHYIENLFEYDDEFGGFVNTSSEFIGPQNIYNPYHRLENMTTSSGSKMYGIRLRGSEYNIGAGILDRRYPIRNGVGSTTLYASFGGWVDESGEYTGTAGSLIVHPLDIIRHFNDYYGRHPNNETMFDIDNINMIKAKTPHHRASVYIREGTTLQSLIEKINSQFGYHSYFNNGRIYFTIIDFEKVDYSKPISEGYNLLNNVKQYVSGYKESYSEIAYSYNKNYLNDNYECVLRLNKSNNPYCAVASQAGGNKKELKIEAPFVYSSAIAAEVTARAAKLLSSNKSEYTFSVRPIDGLLFEPGDYVPMTYTPFDMDHTPVLVLSAKQAEDVVELKVVRFFF